MYSAAIVRVRANCRYESQRHTERWNAAIFLVVTSAPHFNCRVAAPRDRARGKTVKRYTALKSTFSLLKFYRPPRRRTAIPSYRAATVVFMMGIPVTAKCSAMQRGRIIRQTTFCPSIAMTFTIVKSRPGPPGDHKATDST